MKKRIPIILLLVIFSSSVFSAFIRVNNMPNSSADYTSVIEAIDAAQPNDIIYIEGSGTIYNESEIYITKPLTIYGNGYFLTDNWGLQANQFATELSINIFFDAGSEGSIVSGISFKGGLLYIYTSNITIERCYIDVEFRLRAWDQDCSNFLLKQCYVNDGLWMWDMDYSSSNIVITNNIIYGGLSFMNALGEYFIINNVLPGSYNDINALNAVIRNNIVNGINADASDGNVVENNIVGMGNAPVGGLNNLTEIDFSEVFVDYPNGENTSPDAMFQLIEGSVAEGFGLGGVDCGVFDGDFPYVLSGLPAIPRIFEANVSGVGTSEGLQVQIKASSQQ
jgi:hypothetical protein